jgi:hypothetical protein
VTCPGVPLSGDGVPGDGSEVMGRTAP